jgi:spore coat polysaccharide biosynthesis protein SpsF
VRVLGITQARIGSTRLPEKILLKIGNKTLLEYHLERALQSVKVNEWLVATTLEPDSDLIVDIAENLGVKSFKGDTENVLKRFYDAAKSIEKPDYVVRITSDCPLIDPSLIDEVVDQTIRKGLIYCRTSDSFPDGVDVEVFTFSALEDAYQNAILSSDKEHVTPYIRREAEGTEWSFNCSVEYEHIRLTVDEAADFEAIEQLIGKLGSGLSWLDYTSYVIDNRSLFSNQGIQRNEGYIKSIRNDK